MKTQDKLTIAISLAALLLSTVTAVSDKVAAIHAKKAQVRNVVYCSYHLGQQAGVIYAYARAGDKRPAATGETGDRMADEQIAMRTFAAQGYAQSLHVPPDRFVTFRNLLDAGQPGNVADAFAMLNSDLEASGGPKAVAAYELGYETILFGVGYYAPQTASSIVADYSTIRDKIDADLKVLELNYAMPQTVSDSVSFTTALKGVITLLNQLQP